MRVADALMAAALLAGLSGTAVAQTTTPAPPATTPAPVAGLTRSHWIASGFVGSNFAATGTDTSINKDASVDFGGQASYLWRGVVGGEFLADFAPSFRITNIALADNPNVNSYMANAVGAYPLGEDGQFQPYVSGGFGGIQMISNVLNVAGVSNSGTSSGSQMRFGGNIGGGVMGFTGKIGFRADVRYYRATVDNNFTATTGSELLTQSLLSGLQFWRANIGVAVRW